LLSHPQTKDKVFGVAGLMADILQMLAPMDMLDEHEEEQQQ
jgi:hypothetical protein